MSSSSSCPENLSKLYPHLYQTIVQGGSAAEDDNGESKETSGAYYLLALVYLSGPWENILTLWQYPRIW